MSKKLPITMPDELYEAAQKFATERGWSMAYLFREGVHLILTENGREIDADAVHPKIGGKRDNGGADV